MKKLAALLMALVLLFTLAACGGDKEKTGTDADGASQQETSSDKSSEDSVQENDEKDKLVMSFTEFVAVDNENYTIKITELEPGNLAGYGIGMQIENKNKEVGYNFTADVVSINGIDVETFFTEDVPAGKKARVSMFLDDTIIKENGITEYTDIEILLSVGDAEDWLAEPLGKETIHIYPYGEDKAQKYSRKNKVTDIVVLDNDEIEMTVIGWGEDDYNDYELKFYLENKSEDVTYMYSVESCAVNGVEIAAINAYIVSPGKVAFGEFGVYDETLEDNLITEFTDIKLTLRVFDSDDWTADDVAFETVNIYPQGKEKAVKFERPAKDTDKIIVDNDYATVIVTGVDDSDEYFTSLEFFYINKTDKDLVFSIEDASINDNMIDPFYADSVGPGNCKFSTADWDKDEIAEAEITEIESFQFSIRAYDSESFDEYFKESITYNP